MCVLGRGVHVWYTCGEGGMCEWCVFRGGVRVVCVGGRGVRVVLWVFWRAEMYVWCVFGGI